MEAKKTVRKQTRRRIIKPKVGKPAAGMEGTSKQEAAASEDAQPLTATEINQKVKKRIPISLRDPMKTGALDPNYHYRLVRGKNHRLKMFQEAGYEFVTDPEALANCGITRGSSMGSGVTCPSGDSQDELHLMRIPNEYYEEDRKLLNDRIDAIEQNLKPEAERKGLEGKIEISQRTI